MEEIKIKTEYLEKVIKHEIEHRIMQADNEEINTLNINEQDLKSEIKEEETKQRFIRINVLKNDKEICVDVPLKGMGNNRILLRNISFGKDKRILKEMIINNRKFYIYINKNGHLCMGTDVNKIFNIKSRLFRFITPRKIIFFGIVTNTLKEAHQFENIYLGDEIYTKIKRPFKKRKLKHIAIISIKLKDVINLKQIHNNISLGDDEQNKIDITAKYKLTKGMKYYCKKRIKDKLVLLRSTINGRAYILTQVNYEKEYGIKCLLKNQIARILYRFVRKNHINLVFEKETMKANESGYYVFEKIMQYYKEKNKKSNTYFIIDKNSPDYSKVKEKYKKNVIKKYTLKHYIYIYASKYFISSELSNHVINPRLYIKSINNVVRKKPLIFLQHGIMFAKPVENPAARGFYKNNTATNIYKSVVCSDLEAEQFYKMNYSSSDLIKTGLPKFDISYMDKDADKIMFMPTYRYWEEALIFDEEKIKETTYYKLYMRVIKAFEENGLIDKLIISCHPKFAEALKQSMPGYEKLIEKDINRGLEQAKIFITDFSSASYDAHYRGAYIIYNWEEKDYLIKNYKAVPAINETNCDGVPVFNVKELVDEVKKAIKNNYVMEEEYQKRYKKINEFSDGRNGDRLIKEFKKLDII